MRPFSLIETTLTRPNLSSLAQAARTSGAPRFAGFLARSANPRVSIRADAGEALSRAKTPASLVWLRRFAVSAALSAGVLLARSPFDAAVAQSAPPTAPAQAFDAGPPGADFSSNASEEAAAPLSPADPQALMAARALGAYQAIAEAYSPWMETAGSATLRVHRQNDRAIATEDRASQAQQLEADQRRDDAEAQLGALHDQNPKAFDEKMSAWALRAASWRQMSFAQIQATLTPQERAEQSARTRLDELSDQSQASFNDDLSCRASVSDQALSEPAADDGEAFPGFSLPLARAVAAGHELGHCEAAAVFDPSNPGRVRAVWAKLIQQDALGSQLAGAGDNARDAFLSLANESFADSFMTLLVGRLAGRETARAVALSLGDSRAQFGARERLESAESHQTAPALRWMADRLADRGFLDSLATPRQMQQAALGAVRESLRAWLVAHGASAQSALQLVDAATGERAQLQAREQAARLLARSGAISVEDEPSAWSSPTQRREAIEGDLRPELLAARRQASILSPADAQMPEAVVASAPRAARKAP